MMDGISRVFEQSARKVSASVVAITAEQLVQTQSNYGMPDDAFKDFFGEDFFRRFFWAQAAAAEASMTEWGMSLGSWKAPHT